MTTENTTSTPHEPKSKVIYKRNASEAVYGLGLIGAWVYFIGGAATFWAGVSGFLKGLAWPALLVYELLKYLNM